MPTRQQLKSDKIWPLSRRGFLRTLGASAAALSLNSRNLLGADQPADKSPARPKTTATVRGAFVYPPTESLRQAGYYSWPGSTFDAEGRQKLYLDKIKQIERKLDMHISMDDAPLAETAHVNRFLADLKQSPPDGLLLVPFKKGHWPHVLRIIEQAQIPTVVFVTLGILLVDHINQVHRRPGVYLINSLENFDALEQALKMLRTAHHMKQARLINITGSQTSQTIVPVLGTQIQNVPHERFYKEFARTETTAAVKELARAYRENAKAVVEPTAADILEAARSYFALQRIIADEHADALMMDCLPGLQKPHKHVPPCMAFMSLRDEAIPAGCQSDLNATLSLMLIQQLFDKPGFQQNASMETENNHYFGAHCTCASRMNGKDAPPQPYILRNHAEAGWGCVPRVLFSPDQPVTMASYLSGEKPKMLIYSGKVVSCPPIPPTGGCRTNIEMTINEVEDVCDVKGMHQVIFYGDHAPHLRNFCQLYAIETLT